MFVLRLGSTCSLQISDAMASRKKQKTSVEPEVVPKTESDPEWRSGCKSLASRYNYILKNNILSDVKLLVGGVPFHCHRLIMAFGSPVFEPMFFGDLAETGDTVVIPDVDPEGFQHLIRFLYTGEFDVSSATTAFKTYFAADKYCVTALKDLCEDYLCRCSVSPSNVWLFFENSLFLNSEAIRKRCVYVLSRHMRLSLEESSFLDINLTTMESLLSLQVMSVSEGVLLRSVIRWAEHKACTCASLSFEGLLKHLLSRIRFGVLTAREFVDLRCSTRFKEVVSKEDSLSILEHLLNPTKCQLPDWCCAAGERKAATDPKRSSPSSPPRPRGRKFRSPTFLSSCSSTSTSSDSSTSSSTTEDDESDFRL